MNCPFKLQKSYIIISLLIVIFLSLFQPKEGERIIDAERQISSVKSQASVFQEAVKKQELEVEAMKSPMRTPKKVGNRRLSHGGIGYFIQITVGVKLKRLI